MPAPATMAEFWNLVGKSGLVEPDRFASYGHDLQSSGEVPTSPLAMAKLMIRHGLLTRFQADRLLVGKYQGFTLGKYRILERLGQGGMAMVYLAVHVHMRRRVALKDLPTA